MTKNRISEFLTRRGDLTRLAERSGVNVSSLSGYVHGSRTPSPATAERIAAALDVNVDDVFPNHGQRARPIPAPFDEPKGTP